MKIIIDKSLFLEKLSLASRFISTRLASTPSLQGVLIEGKDKEVRFYSTNLASYFYTTMKTQGGGRFRAVLEPKKIAEFLSLLDAGKVEVEVQEKTVLIVKEKTKGTFPTISAADFPPPPQIKEKEQEIKKDVFLENLPLVLFSASQDESRPVLTGINFISQDEELLIVATDGFRLSLIKAEREGKVPAMLVPREFLDEVLRTIIKEDKLSMAFSKEEKLVLFKSGENTFYSRLIEGEFPPFEKVVPDSHKTRAVVDREELLRNVRLVSVFAREVSNIVIFSFAKDGLRLSPKTEEEGQSVAFQEAQVEGEGQKVAFNFKFVLDFLNHTTAKKIVVEVLRPDSPAVFREEGNKNFLHVIMPVRIQS
ncbi:DNA polymerase III subunit beta [Candidatus Roizmanbacteria bacterium]|nr:DNA polymerase III subunit beta [Candidatus Roizmanbacteria bacterium]